MNAFCVMCSLVAVGANEYQQLYGAVSRGDIQAVKYHLESGTTDFNDEFRGVAMQTATAIGNVSILELLIQVWPEEVAKIADFGETVLHMAIRYGHPDCLRLLLQHWPEGIRARTVPNERMPFTLRASTLLHYAAEFGQAESFRLLLERWPAGSWPRPRMAPTAFMWQRKGGLLRSCSSF